VEHDRLHALQQQPRPDLHHAARVRRQHHLGPRRPGLPRPCRSGSCRPGPGDERRTDPRRRSTRPPGAAAPLQPRHRPAAAAALRGSSARGAGDTARRTSRAAAPLRHDEADAPPGTPTCPAPSPTNAAARSAHSGRGAAAPVFLHHRAAARRVHHHTSTPARSNAAMFARASARARSRRPACASSAPQHTCAGTGTTSQPFASSTRTVARFTRANSDLLHAAGEHRRPSHASVPRVSRPPAWPPSRPGSRPSGCAAPRTRARRPV
jgi:hypothetical protein